VLANAVDAAGNAEVVAAGLVRAAGRVGTEGGDEAVDVVDDTEGVVVDGDDVVNAGATAVDVAVPALSQGFGGEDIVVEDKE
jgi:hypothetical protein